MGFFPFHGPHFLDPIYLIINQEQTEIAMLIQLYLLVFGLPNPNMLTKIFF